MEETISTEEYIRNLLEEGPLSYEEIVQRAIGDPEFTSNPKPYQSYNVVFNKFLKLGIIQIDDYKFPEGWDPEKKRIQSMNIKNVIFSLVRREPFEIFKMITQLDTENYTEVHKKLKKLFKDKITEIEIINQKQWDLLKENVIIRDPRMEDLLILEGETELEAFLIAHSEHMTDFEINDVHAISEKIEKYENNPPSIEKYDNLNVYYFKHPINSKNVDHRIERLLNTPIYEDEDGKDIFLKETPEYDDLFYEKEFSIDGNINKDEYLNSFGFEKPRKMISRQVETLFEKILFHVITKERNNAEIQKLSRALSENEDSIELLDQIILEMTQKELLTFKNI